MRADASAVPRTAIFLGLAGLIPFCLAPLAMWYDVHHTRLYAEVLANYALAIICFLVGIWWGLALIRRSTTALLLSNAVVILAFSTRSLLAYSPFFLVCAALFIFTVLIERRHRLFKPQPTYYAILRLGLSGVAAVMLSLAAMLTGQSALSVHQQKEVFMQARLIMEPACPDRPAVLSLASDAAARGDPGIWHSHCSAADSLYRVVGRRQPQASLPQPGVVRTFLP